MGVGPSVAIAQPRSRSHTTLSAAADRKMGAPRLSCPDYMTHYDVKQLMRDVNRNRDDVPNRNQMSLDDPIEQLHQQFSSSAEHLPQVHKKKETVRATMFNASHRSASSSGDSGDSDSGIESARVSVDENHYWGQCVVMDQQDREGEGEEEAVTPCAPTPATPTAATTPSIFGRPAKKRRFLPKRVFGRKTELRTRSKSLGANQVFRMEGDKPAPLFGGSSLLNREWELVTMSEMCRRLSLDELDQLELPIPEGASSSQILDELMIRQIMEILPPRAEGYPWVNVYNSEKHGYSLATLYRKMIEFDEDLSPVLLIIRTTSEHVFGAVVSGAIRPSDHYTGTGDSCLLWRFTGVAPHTREVRAFTWTGDNQFFVNAAKDALSIGAGGGHNGLWLDADLNHGRSQRCDTFDNEPLAGEKEDFIIQFVEAYGFRM